MLASQIVFLQNMEETKKEDLESRKERGHCEEWREAVSDEGSMAVLRHKDENDVGICGPPGIMSPG